MAQWPLGYDRVILDEVDSTSAHAARLAPTTPTWILAHAQTAARGRRGRAWVNPAGNFAASLVWRPGGTQADLALRSFVASLALQDALTALGVVGLSLKWPNDVLLQDRKVAGILLESPAPGLLILGIGVNLVAAPGVAEVEAGAVPPVDICTATGRALAAEGLLDALAAAFATREAEFTTWGFAPIRRAWLRHAARLGQRITARTMDQTYDGVFETVDADGQLVLQTADGPRHITAGDVFFDVGTPCS
ncbi:MAG: biotin--[acetyl-CoA-carboxylase] ligase [Pseudomonadota bacterium]